ncbi:zinc-binding dehydrogenase [Sphingomonas endolithica]
MRGEVATVVAETMPLRQAADARRRIEAGGVFGRIVLTTR